MIFYFSGTGNSKWVATELANKIKDKAVCITKAKKQYKLGKDESIGFVFPIYAYSAPDCIWDFIKSVEFEKYDYQYFYFIATCHSHTGAIDRLMSAALSSKDIICNAGFSIRMPNNYIISPFCKTDTVSKRRQILAHAVERLNRIALRIKSKESVFDVHRGYAADFLSSVAPKLFHRIYKADSFYVMDQCDGCGVCAEVCPTHNIEVERFPLWGDKCQMCQACLNHCPKEAIQYGRFTVGKNRYVFSELDLPIRQR